MEPGDLIQFKSGVTVVLLDSVNGGKTWHVMFVRGPDKGTPTWMSLTALNDGTVMNLEGIDHALDALHETDLSLERLRADIAAKAGVGDEL